MTKAFPDVVRALASIDDVVLDAELVIPDSAGRSDFEELRQRSLIRRLPLIQEAAALRPAALIVFDVLQAKGEDRALPLSERKAWLAANVTPRPGLQVIEGHEKHGEAMFESIIAQDFEGLVAKRLDAPYKAGRRPTWLKIKNREYSRREAVEFWR